MKKLMMVVAAVVGLVLTGVIKGYSAEPVNGAGSLSDKISSIDINKG
jgi:hypothetical protein